jgi:hypothetical protein
MALLIAASANAAVAATPMFDGFDSQITVNSGVASEISGMIVPPWDFVPYFTTEIRYSQPNTIFRLQGRQNLSVNKNVGRGYANGWDWDMLDEYIFILSEDAFLYHTDNWYYGLGMGAGMQLHYNERIGSLLIFQFKIFAGRKITNRLNLELFFQHFSNGHVTDDNYSYNFYGLGAVFKF